MRKLSTTSDTWLIYALGSGWGHLNRAIALGRIAASKHNVKILTNTPYFPYIESFLPKTNCQFISISSTADFQTTYNQTQEILRTTNYQCLIVDTFPRGLGGELTDIFLGLETSLRVLIHRDLNDEYVKAKKLHKFVADTFDLVLVPGEGSQVPLANLSSINHTPPWLLRSAEELPTKKYVEEILRLNPQNYQSKIVLILASGIAEELSFYGELTNILSKHLKNTIVRCLSSVKPEKCPENLWVFHWPVMECLPIADVVVGGGGYNTIYECQALNIPLVAFPWSRLYDRQRARVERIISANHRNHDLGLASSPLVLANNLEGAIAAVSNLLNSSLAQPYGRRHNFTNGALRAVSILESTLESRNP